MNKAILCVDDEKAILESLKEQISNNITEDDTTVEIAESAEEAWEVIEELVEDDIKVLIIVSDWLMPGVKGDEFLIRVHQKFPTIYTVLLTGQADEAAIINARENANLGSYLSKPWEEEELIKIIKTAYDETRDSMC